MYPTRVTLPESVTVEHLMEEVEPRNSVWPGKSYATYPVNGETPLRLATELCAVWHGQATAMNAVCVLFGGKLPNEIGNLIGTYYLHYVLRLTLEEAKDFQRPDTEACKLGIARQSWLANSGDRDALMRSWREEFIEKVEGFAPDYLSFWQFYYDLFGGRRKRDIKFLAKQEFNAISRWLWIFRSANPSCGGIIHSLENDIVRIK